MTTHNDQKYKRQLSHIHGLDPESTFAGCQSLCGWLTDGDPQNEPHKHKQACPRCWGDDRFRYSPEFKRFFCNHCMPTGGWDAIALIEKFADGGEAPHREAVRLLAEATGYEAMVSAPTSEKQTETSETTFRTWELTEDSTILIDVQAHRPEITFADYERAGAVCFSDKLGDGIAVPVYDNDGNVSSHVRYYKRGGKPMLLKDSKSGIVGINAWDALRSKRQATMIFKTAGVSDSLIMSKTIAAVGLEDDYYAFTNGAGENENPEKFDSLLRPALEGQIVVVIADNDPAGEKGAKKWAGHMATYAKDVRIVHPPKEWNGESIKDLRDCVANAGITETWQYLLAAAEQAEPVKPNLFAGLKSSSGGVIIPRLIDVSKLDTTPLEWLWDNKFPYDNLSLIAGMPKIGKSVLTIYMAATISQGRKWCDGSPCERGSVLFFAGEDTPEEYARRLESNGADLTKVRILEGAELCEGTNPRKEIDITLASINVLEATIDMMAKETGLPVRMIVIDPISNFWGEVNENSNSGVRSVLFPLQQFFQRRKQKIAPILVHHLRKTGDSHAQQRVTGSVGITGTARNIWGVYIDPKDPAVKQSEKKRYLVHFDGNVCVDPTGIAYLLVRPGNRVDVVDAAVEQRGDDFEAAWLNAKPGKGRPPEELRKAMAWLVSFLGNGEKPFKKIAAAWEEAGHSEYTVRKAAKQLGVVKRHEGFGKDKVAYWSLPGIFTSTDDNDISPINGDFSIDKENAENA